MSGGTQKTDAGGRDVNYYFSLSLFLLAGFGKVNESIFFTKQITGFTARLDFQRQSTAFSAGLHRIRLVSRVYGTKTFETLCWGAR